MQKHWTWLKSAAPMVILGALFYALNRVCFGMMVAFQKFTAGGEPRVAGRSAKPQAGGRPGRLNYEHYQLMAANFPNGVVALFDHDLRYLVAAGTALKQCGLSKELLEGKTIWEALPAEIVRALEPHYRAALAGSADLFEVSFAGRYFLVYTVPFRESQEQIGMSLAQDITPQKQAEAALREERDFSAAVLETIGALVMVIDREGRIVRFNRACQKATGYTFEEVHGKSIWDLPLLLPEEVEGIQKVVSELLAGQPNNFENYLVAKDGHRCLIAWANTMLSGTDGSVRYIVGTGIDVTEQRRAEEALRESEGRFRSAAECFPGAFTMYDTNRRFTFVNARTAELLGREECEILGHTNEELFPPEMTEQYLPALNRCVESRAPQSIETTLSLAGGKFTYLIHLVPLLDSQGQIRQILGIAYDVTDRNRAAEALKASERRERHRAAELAALLDAVPTPVLIAHDAECTHITGNRAADELLKIPGGAEASLAAPLESRPRHFRPVKEGRDLRTDELPAQMAARGVQVQNFEFSLVFDDGTIRYLLGYGTPLLDEEERPRGAVHVLIDITERIQAEQKLKEALAKETVLRREIHHRVKNNLQVIISLLYLQSVHISDPRMREILLESQVRTRSIAITYEMLSQSDNLSKIEAAGYVRQLAAHLLTAYQVNPKTVALTVDAEGISLCLDQAIPCGLIINELASNVLKHAFPDGREGRLVIELRRAGTHIVQLTVRDNGVSFPERFDPANARSMGLGLVRDLTRQLGGSVEFHRDHGALVTITFPTPEPLEMA